MTPPPIVLTPARSKVTPPPDATKDTHGPLREICKTVCLGLGYGMGAKTLAVRLDMPITEAEELVSLYRRAYPVYDAWLDAAVNYAMLNNVLPGLASEKWRVPNEL